MSRKDGTVHLLQFDQTTFDAQKMTYDTSKYHVAYDKFADHAWVVTYKPFPTIRIEY